MRNFTEEQIAANRERVRLKYVGDLVSIGGVPPKEANLIFDVAWQVNVDIQTEIYDKCAGTPDHMTALMLAMTFVRNAMDAGIRMAQQRSLEAMTQQDFERLIKRIVGDGSI